MAVNLLSNMLARRAPKSLEDLKLMINATNVERLDTGLMNAEKKAVEKLKDVKRNVTTVVNLAISRKIALISDTPDLDQEEDLHLVPVLDQDQAVLILEIEEEEEAHPVAQDPEVVIDLIPEISIRRITRERVTRSTEALTRREAEAEAQAMEARVIVAPEIMLTKMETRVEVEAEVEANNKFQL